MSDTVISVENVSKLYRIGKAEQRHDNLVSELTSLLKSPFRKLRDLYRLNTYRDNGDSEDTIWALKDVSFEVKRGEVLGIIGRNGAGKSTLLKILSQITEPTKGRIRIRGRVASLLEVGTGFHPELTGRENVYLNGTILGMTKKEIDRKFDEIVDFSGVEKFLDTPIKRYSSGMKVRLAFAVAAHLEPEILVIDEVLAVGDAEFQKKCFGKMEEVARYGRTVLFVSHNMNAVNRLCSRATLLIDGELILESNVSEVVNHYLTAGTTTTSGFSTEQSPDKELEIIEVRLLDDIYDTIPGDYDFSREFKVQFKIFSRNQHPSGYVTMSLRDIHGTPVLFSDVRDSCIQGIREGYSTYTVAVPGHTLTAQRYFVTVAISSNTLGKIEVLQNILSITLRDFLSFRGEKRIGYFANKLNWELNA